MLRRIWSGCGNAGRTATSTSICFIDQSRIGFGTSALAADGYVITNPAKSREGDKTLFVVSYQDAEQAKFQLAFFYDPAGAGGSRLRIRII